MVIELARQKRFCSRAPIAYCSRLGGELGLDSIEYLSSYIG